MKNNMDFWHQEEGKKYEFAYNQVDTFFENLYHHIHDDTININSIDYGNLTYREEQNSYALDIMDAIKKKQILLLQAGVGTGKSFGYLIPIFYTYQNVEKFNKIIISTSSIALQQQLLTDIHRISKMLQIDMKAEIAKGIHNYACLRKIESRLRSDYTSIDKKLILESVVSQIEELDSSDKSDLMDISEQVWKEIQLQGRRYCSNCSYTNRCPFYKEQQKISKSNIIIMNHDDLVGAFTRNLIDKGKIIQSADMILIDEAYQLESAMQNWCKRKVNFSTIKNLVYQVNYMSHSNFEDEVTSGVKNKNFDSGDALIQKVSKLFWMLGRSLSMNFSRKDKSNLLNTEGDRFTFHYNKNITHYLDEVIYGLETLFQEVEHCNNIVNTQGLKDLKRFYLILQDMRKAENSCNIYWVEFWGQENDINLWYVPKNNLDISEIIFSKQVPIICTSETLLDSHERYHYFQEGINLPNNRRIIHGEHYLSPFDYQNNTLFYYNPMMTNLNGYRNYILALAMEIANLIRITNGKALVLFTSNKCMSDVYTLLLEEKFDFQILLQTNTNANKMKQIFATDTNSCLFVTGNFWEEIDIKGKALSNLIIAQLPFEAENAVTQHKANHYKLQDSRYREVYFPNLLVKLEQEIGRLIRSSTDTGIVSCLDSRFSYYKEWIQENLTITNYTTDLEDVIRFSEEKIIKEELSENRQVRKLGMKQ